MSTVSWTNRVEPAQQTAAKVAGVLCLLLTATAVFTDFYVRRRLIVPGSAAETARNIASSEQLFRIGVGGDLIIYAGDIALAVALYAIFRLVSRNVALIAAFWRLGECLLGTLVTVSGFAAFQLLRGHSPSGAVNTEQLQMLGQWFLSVDTAGNRIAGVFFGLSSTLFCLLWFKSRYIPRPLAVLGIIASLVPVIVQFAAIVVPTLAEVPLRRARSGLPIIAFEVALGVWLLVKGIHAPMAES